MSDLTIANARVLTLSGDEEPRRGAKLRTLGVIEHGFVRVKGDRIAAVGPGDPPPGDEDERRVDAGGAVLMPAFVDCHTHACWAGQRFDELEQRLAGTSYLEILEAGGGIMATVRAVRAASVEELTDLLVMRLRRMAALGTATVEIKSGYGLETETELKMLRAIRAAGKKLPMTLHPTFLGAHAIDPDNPDCVDQIIEQTLPAVTAEFPGIACDAYCEQGAWSVEQTQRLFDAATKRGCPLRVHTDQFHALGMTTLAVEMGTLSVDHLEASADEELQTVAVSDTIAVVLPCSGFQLDDRYAPARRLVDLGAALALATNYNPGSGPTPSMPFAIALAVRKLRLTVAEAITAATHNAACVLGLQDEVGSITVGRRADLQLLDCRDERELACELATPGPRMVVVGGKVLERGSL